MYLIMLTLPGKDWQYYMLQRKWMYDNKGTVMLAKVGHRYSKQIRHGRAAHQPNLQQLLYANDNLTTLCLTQENGTLPIMCWFHGMCHDPVSFSQPLYSAGIPSRGGCGQADLAQRHLPCGPCDYNQQTRDSRMLWCPVMLFALDNNTVSRDGQCLWLELKPQIDCFT